MMGYFSKIFLRGTLTLLPLVLTIYPLYIFFKWLNTSSNNLIQYVFPELSYIPGTGLLLGLMTIFLLGILMSSQWVRRLFRMIEIPFRNIPIVKSLYNAIKELANYLAPEEESKKAKKVVLIQPPSTDIQLVGFITQNDPPGQLPGTQQEQVAVYIPMSYQIGGFTVFLPSAWVTGVDVTVEDAMRNVLTGWMTSSQRT